MSVTPQYGRVTTCSAPRGAAPPKTTHSNSIHVGQRWRIKRTAPSGRHPPPSRARRKAADLRRASKLESLGGVTTQQLFFRKSTFCWKWVATLGHGGLRPHRPARGQSVHKCTD